MLTTASSIHIPSRDEYNFIQIIHNGGDDFRSFFPLVKNSVSESFINIKPFSNSLFSQLERSPPTLILLIRPSAAVLNACKSLSCHVILVQGLECKLVPPLGWIIGLYCQHIVVVACWLAGHNTSYTLNRK